MCVKNLANFIAWPEKHPGARRLWTFHQLLNYGMKQLICVVIVITLSGVSTGPVSVKFIPEENAEDNPGLNYLINCNTA